MQTLSVRVPMAARPAPQALAAARAAFLPWQAQLAPADAAEPSPAPAPPGDLRRWVDQDFEEYFFE